MTQQNRLAYAYLAAILGITAIAVGGIVYLLNMAPIDAMNDQGNCRPTDAKFCGDRSLALPGRDGTADLQNLFGVQLRLAMPFASAFSALGVHVGNVVGISTEKQMVWVDTSRVVASMKNVQGPVDGIGTEA